MQEWRKPRWHGPGSSLRVSLEIIQFKYLNNSSLCATVQKNEEKEEQ